MYYPQAPEVDFSQPAVEIKNRDKLFLEEIFTLLTEKRFRYSDGEEDQFQEAQIGIQKRPTSYPFISLHAADTDFGVQSSGTGAGMRARRKNTEFLVEIRYETPDPTLGWDRLLDLKWFVIETLSNATNGKHYRFLDIDNARALVITPEDVDEDLPWGFSGQIIVQGYVDLN